MRGIRRIDASHRPARDVEAQAPKGVASEAFPTPPGASHNPVFLARVILRKVATLLVSSDEADITRPGGMVTLFKDVIAGVILGILLLSVFIFLDHRGVVHFQSAHHFRAAAVHLLKDPETIATLEESAELKFLTIVEYAKWRGEIDRQAEKLASMREALEEQMRKGEEARRGIDAIQDEHERLTRRARAAYELDKYCGSCKWANSSCERRVQFMQDTYQMSKLGSQIGLMKDGNCRRE